jgi:hypothetical protein
MTNENIRCRYACTVQKSMQIVHIVLCITGKIIAEFAKPIASPIIRAHPRCAGDLGLQQMPGLRGSSSKAGLQNDRGISFTFAVHTQPVPVGRCTIRPCCS